jgi:hypothetical protein
MARSPIKESAMRKTIGLAAILMAAATQASAMDSLSGYAGRSRILVLFAADGDPKLAQQIELLKGKDNALADRDMVVLEVVGEKVRPIYGNANGIHARQLRQDMSIDSPGFRAVLVGKDGGVKLRSQQVVSDAQLFDLIDHMPMRKAGQR